MINGLHKTRQDAWNKIVLLCFLADSDLCVLCWHEPSLRVHLNDRSFVVFYFYLFILFCFSVFRALKQPFPDEATQGSQCEEVMVKIEFFSPLCDGNGLNMVATSP